MLIGTEDCWPYLKVEEGLAAGFERAFGHHTLLEVVVAKVVHYYRASMPPNQSIVGHCCQVWAEEGVVVLVL